MQIIKLLQDDAFSFNTTSDGTFFTMIDAENVVTILPKLLSVPDFNSIKKEIGDEHRKAQQQKRHVVIDSEQTDSEKSTAPIPPFPNPISAKKQTKTTIKIKIITALSDLSSTPAQSDKDTIPLHQVFKAAAAPTPAPLSTISPALPPDNLQQEVQIHLFL